MKIGELFKVKYESFKRFQMAKKKVQKKISRLESKLDEIFGNVRKLDVGANYVSFEVRDNEVSYDNLKKVSELLETTNINFTGREKYDGGCETCGWGAIEDPATISVSQVSHVVLEDLTREVD